MPEYPIFNCKNSDDVVKAVREHKIELSSSGLWMCLGP